MRRRARFDAAQAELANQLDLHAGDPAAADDEGLEDDRLRLIFTCCHPALPPARRRKCSHRNICNEVSASRPTSGRQIRGCWWCP
jgi:RNA polymerase sigma-70 factor (ECF subfamily)